MDLQKMQNRIIELFDKEQIPYSFNLEDGMLELKSHISINGIDDDVLLDCTFFGNGNLFFSCIFDSLKCNYKNLDLVNDFNNCDFWFKALINDEKFLEISNTSTCITDENGINVFIFFLNQISSKDTVERLLKLTKKTKA